MVRLLIAALATMNQDTARAVFLVIKKRSAKEGARSEKVLPVARQADEQYIRLSNRASMSCLLFAMYSNI